MFQDISPPLPVLIPLLVEHFKFFSEKTSEKCFEFYSNFSAKNQVKNVLACCPIQRVKTDGHRHRAHSPGHSHRFDLLTGAANW
jgi:hypothetical protein